MAAKNTGCFLPLLLPGSLLLVVFWPFDGGGSSGGEYVYEPPPPHYPDVRTFTFESFPSGAQVSLFYDEEPYVVGRTPFKFERDKARQVEFQIDPPNGDGEVFYRLFAPNTAPTRFYVDFKNPERGKRIVNLKRTLEARALERCPVAMANHPEGYLSAGGRYSVRQVNAQQLTVTVEHNYHLIGISRSFSCVFNGQDGSTSVTYYGNG